MAYSPYEPNSLGELSNALSDAQSAGLVLPPVLLVRTRSDLDSAPTIGTDTPRRFIDTY